jgi:orotate phosphoribosyltransferase
MDKTALATAIHQRAKIRGDFLLRSGARSDVYFDKYRFEADPALLRAIAEHLRPLVPPGTQALAGLEMGGIPVATVLSQLTGLPTRFVRKEAKTYGTCQIAEGGDIAGVKLLLVEDVITSGGAVLDAAQALRGLGAELLGVVCVIDRQSGGRENLTREGLPLWAALTRTEIEATPGPHS